MQYDEVRCPGHRPHYANNAEHDKCWSLLLGIDSSVECDVVVKCKVCKNYIRVISNGEHLTTIEEIDKIEFVKAIAGS
jgi:hypothetical protein